MTYLGAIGLGLVWGWLMLSFDERIFGRFVVIVILTLSTLILTVEVYWLANLGTTPFFLGAAGVAAFLHSEWRRELRRRSPVQYDEF